MAGLETGRGRRRAPEPARQDAELLRRLLRARDRMDAASQQARLVRRLAHPGGGAYDGMRPRGAEFTQEPVERHGSVDASFRDPSGNGWKPIETRRD